MERKAFTERRRVPRTSMLGGGSFVAKKTSQSCVVLNFSPLGAGVRLLIEGKAPEAVILHLPGGAVRAARRRWQHQADVGFEFVEPLPDACNTPVP
jgi:hypothetical protein